jgi:hypothetical protein
MNHPLQQQVVPSSGLTCNQRGVAIASITRFCSHFGVEVTDNASRAAQSPIVDLAILTLNLLLIKKQLRFSHVKWAFPIAVMGRSAIFGKQLGRDLLKLGCISPHTLGQTLLKEIVHELFFLW